MIPDHEADAMTAPYELLGQKNLPPLGPATVGKDLPVQKEPNSRLAQQNSQMAGGLRRSARPSASSPGSQPTV